MPNRLRLPSSRAWRAGVPVLFLPVGAAAYWLFHGVEDGERGGLARLLELRDSPRLAPWLGLLRMGMAALAALTLLKFVCLSGGEADGWALALELLRSF